MWCVACIRPRTCFTHARLKGIPCHSKFDRLKKHWSNGLLMPCHTWGTSSDMHCSDTTKPSVVSSISSSSCAKKASQTTSWVQDTKQHPFLIHASGISIPVVPFFFTSWARRWCLWRGSGCKIESKWLVCLSSLSETSKKLKSDAKKLSLINLQGIPSCPLTNWSSHNSSLAPIDATSWQASTPNFSWASCRTIDPEQSQCLPYPQLLPY